MPNQVVQIQKEAPKVGYTEGIELKQCLGVARASVMAQFGGLPVVLNLVVWKSPVDHTNSYVGFQLRSNTICTERVSGPLLIVWVRPRVLFTHQ